MKKIIEITLKAAVAVLAILLAASCVFEKENPVGRANGRQHVAVQLGIGTEGMAQTKADDNTGIPITTPDAENPVPTIETKIKTLRIYAYTKEGANFILCGYYQAFAKADGTFNTTGHVMDLNLPASGTVDVYFRAVANESAMLPGGGKEGTIEDNYAISVGRDSQTGGLTFPNAIGFDELNNILYTVDQKFENGMPMYADQKVSINVDNVGSMNTDDGHNGHFILQETVNLTLTRSLAKIEVYAAESASATTAEGKTDDTSVTITGVSLANVPQSGNLFTAPAAKATLTYTDFNGESGGTGYSTPFLKDEAETVTVNKKVSETATADIIQNPDNYTLVSNAYYLAENNQGSTRKENGKDIDVYEYGSDAYPVVGENGVTTAATVLKIDYTVGGTSKTGYVKMPQIKRNTWYKVLARITANGQMALTLKVLPWNDTDEQVINFADNVSLNGPISWSGNGAFAGSTFSFSGSNANLTANCTFTLDAPQAGTWYVSLTDGDISNFQLETTVSGRTVTGNTVSGPIVPGQPVVVIVKTLTNNYLQGTKTANLQITARRMDGTTLIVRHGTGEDAQDAYFTIVQPQN